MLRFFAIFCGAALIISIAGPTNARGHGKTLGTIEAPAGKDWGDLYLAEVELPKARVHPTEYYCPGDDIQNSICIGASIIYRNANVRRILASSRRASLRSLPSGKLRVKGLGPHAARYGTANYAVVLMERTEDGYFWMPFEAQIDRGIFCLPKSVMEEFNITLDLRPRASQEWESCFRIGK